MYRYAAITSDRTDIFYAGENNHKRMFRDLPIKIQKFYFCSTDIADGEIYDFKDFSILITPEENFLWRNGYWTSCNDPSLRYSRELEKCIIKLDATHMEKIDISCFLAIFGNIIILKGHHKLQIFKLMEDKIKLLHELEVETSTEVSYFISEENHLHLIIEISQSQGLIRTKTFYFTEDGTELFLHSAP